MPGSSSGSPRPGDRLVAAGALLFLAGLVAVGAVFVPFLLGRNERGAPLSLATFLTVAGMGLALAGLARQARHRPPDPGEHR